MVKNAIIVLFFLNILSVKAQEYSAESAPARSDEAPSKKEYYWFTPYASVSVPNPTGNEAFRKNFAGVYEVNAGIEIMPLKGLFIGPVYKNATLKITGITGATYFHYSPLMKINNAGIRVGGKTFLGSRNRMIGKVAVTAGQNWTAFKDIRCMDSTMAVPVPKYSCTYLEPELSLYFLVEKNFAIGISFSYDIYSRNFNPYDICLESWKAIGTVGGGPTQYFSFGLGFSYSFDKRKE